MIETTEGLDTILVIDDVPESIWPIVSDLEARYEVLVATSGPQALRLTADEETRPDLILLDINMPEMDGFDVIQKLKEQPHTVDIPVIFLAARTDTEEEQNCLNAGAVDFIAKPSAPSVIQAKIESILNLRRAFRRRDHLIEDVNHLCRQIGEQEMDQAHAPAAIPALELVHRKRPTVLVVDDTPENVQLLIENLEIDYEVLFATSGRRALEIVASSHPDLILLDVMMPDLDGFQVCARLKADNETVGIPVIFATAIGVEQYETKGINLGAVDYVTKPFKMSVVKARVASAVRQKLALDQRSFRLRTMNNVNRDLENTVRAKTEVLTRLHAELKISEEKYRGVCENAIEGMFRADLKGAFLEVNHSMAQLLGYNTPFDLIKASGVNGWRAILEQTDVDRLLCKLQEDNRIEGMDLRLKGKAEVPVHCHLTGRLAESTRRRRVLEAFCTDITEKKRREEDLRNSEERYRTVFETAPDFILTHDDRGMLISINPFAAGRLSKSTKDLSGCMLQELVVPAHQGQFQAEYIERLGRESMLSGTAWLQTDDQNELVLEYRSSQSFVNGRCIYTVCARDITEQLAAARQAEILQKHLTEAQKVEAVGTLASGIAHDFNNILGGILGYAELAGKDLTATDAMKLDLDEIIKASLRARDLVSQILSFTRQAEGEPTPVLICTLAKEVGRLLRASLPAYITVKVSVPPEELCVVARATQLHQLLMNLGTNAAHAMNDRKGTLGITVSSNADEVLIDVSDTGCGIPEEIRQEIFEPYFTTKEMGKGTGLGLATVRDIINELNGNMTLESKVDSGTIFHLTLPIGRTVKTEESPTNTEAVRGSGEHILLVDDEFTLTCLGKEILELQGYRVDTANSAGQALALFEAAPDSFDLLITDQTMPDSTGLELARKVREQQPGLPMLITSGNLSPFSRDELRKEGISDCLAKPLSAKMLCDKVREALNRS